MLSLLITGTVLLAGLSDAMLASSQGAVLANQVSAKRSEIVRRATAAHDAEKRHSKEPYCQDPHYTQSDLNDCAARELRTSLTYYHAYADAIAQLLEMQVADAKEIDQTPYRKASLAFRSAETSWQDYSDKACRAVASQNEGGSMQPLTDLSCREELTQRHMEELATVFSFLWDASER
jgi:uncharacterized protein YecT (DUF1311 family)